MFKDIVFWKCLRQHSLEIPLGCFANFLWEFLHQFHFVLENPALKILLVILFKRISDRISRLLTDGIPQGVAEKISKRTTIEILKNARAT